MRALSVDQRLSDNFNPTSFRISRHTAVKDTSLSSEWQGDISKARSALSSASVKTPHLVLFIAFSLPLRRLLCT